MRIFLLMLISISTLISKAQLKKPKLSADIGLGYTYVPFFLDHIKTKNGLSIKFPIFFNLTYPKFAYRLGLEFNQIYLNFKAANNTNITYSLKNREYHFGIKYKLKETDQSRLNLICGISILNVVFETVSSNFYPSYPGHFRSYGTGHCCLLTFPIQMEYQLKTKQKKDISFKFGYQRVNFGANLAINPFSRDSKYKVFDHFPLLNLSISSIINFSKK